MDGVDESVNEPVGEPVEDEDADIEPVRVRVATIVCVIDAVVVPKSDAVGDGDAVSDAGQFTAGAPTVKFPTARMRLS